MEQTEQSAGYSWRRQYAMKIDAVVPEYGHLQVHLQAVPAGRIRDNVLADPVGAASDVPLRGNRVLGGQGEEE